MCEMSTDYQTAYRMAQREANRLNRPIGIEKAREYGRTVYRVKLVPARPDQRFGWETRCQIVDPEVQS